jgi:DnaJ-class molecular chaperone
MDAGVKFEIEHLDGHKVYITSKPGEVIKHESVLQVRDEGMPMYGHSHVKGALFIQFDVKWPEKLELTDAMRKVLAGMLPGPASPAPPLEPGQQVHLLEEIDLEARRSRERLARDAYDSDEEGGGGGMGGQRVQCAHQ